MEKLKNNKGFTLIEVIIAVSILTVGILAVGALQTSSVRGNYSAWTTSEATTIAVAKIEELMHLSWDDANLIVGLHNCPNRGPYAISWNVTDPAFIAQTKGITVTVSGVGRVATLSRVIGKINGNPVP
jgi:type IV pilus assembly protein PilV